MRLRDFRQRELCPDAHGELASADPFEQLAGSPEQLVARDGVVTERWSRQKERAFLVQQLRVDRIDRPARLAEQHHHAAWYDDVEASEERRFSDRIVDDVD